MILFTIICGAWFISEVVLTRLLKSKLQGSRELDKSSLVFLWITIVISIFLGVILMIKTGLIISGSPVPAYSGLVVIVTGIAVRFTAIRKLGKYFTVDVAIHDDQHLITGGIYKHLRHPSYTGSLLSFAGLGLSLNNWLSLAVILIPVTAAFIYRIRVEEKALMQRFGDSYREYCRTTYGLIPFIW